MDPVLVSGIEFAVIDHNIYLMMTTTIPIMMCSPWRWEWNVSITTATTVQNDNRLNLQKIFFAYRKFKHMVK